MGLQANTKENKTKQKTLVKTVKFEKKKYNDF